MQHAAAAGQKRLNLQPPALSPVKTEEEQANENERSLDFLTATFGCGLTANKAAELARHWRSRDPSRV
jgi:hypothetical protein